MLFLKKLFFGDTERKAFYMILADYLDSNVDPKTALNSLYNRAVKDQDLKKYALKDILNKVKNGKTFPEALDGYGTKSEIILIQAGERGGDLRLGLLRAVELSNSVDRIKSAMLSSLKSPFVFLMIFCGIMFYYQNNMVGTYLDIIPLERWDEGGKFIYYTSLYFVQNFFYIVGGILALIFAIKSSIGYHFPMRNILDKFIPYNIYKMFYGSIVLLTLGSLMSSNLDAVTSINLIKTNTPRYVNRFLDKILNNVKQGKAIGNAFDVGLFDKKITGIIEDRAALNNFNDAIMIIADRSMEVTIKNVQTTTKILGTIIIVCVFGFVLQLYRFGVSIPAMLQ